MRLFLIVFLHALVILFLLIAHPQAAEGECKIYKLDYLIVSQVFGR